MAIPVGFTLPPFDATAGDLVVVPREPRTLTADYFDTPDLRLARWGITVRYRDGDGEGWTVKLPEGEAGPALVRRELHFEGPADQPPAGVTSLLLASTRSTPLVPVARIRTVRTGVDLIDGEGAVAAEIVHDDVSVLLGNDVASRFREVEVELGSRPPAGMLDEVVARLRAAGAGAPDTMPKVIRALGERALDPPEVAAPALGKRPSGHDFARHELCAAVTQLLRHDPGIRIGDDAEDTHQALVGTQRLLAILKVFGPLIDDATVTSLRDDCRWLDEMLQTVDGLDQLLTRFRRQTATISDDTGALAPLFRQLARERDVARANVLAAINSTRYVALLDRLVTAAAAGSGNGSGATAPAGETLGDLIAGPWRKLAKAMKAPADPPNDVELHRIHRFTFRIRHAAEAAAPLFGKKAAAFAESAVQLQATLDEHRGAAAAEVWLRHTIEGGDAAEELLSVQTAETAASLAGWRQAWTVAVDARRRWQQ